jgi:E3 ubiquitin-protein ligase RFWD2
LFLFQLQADLQFIKEDVATLDKQRLELVRARERYSMKLSMLLHASNHGLAHAAMTAPCTTTGNGLLPAKNEPGMDMHSVTARKDECRENMSSMTSQKRNFLFGGGPRDSFSNSQGPFVSPNSAITKKKRVLAQVCNAKAKVQIRHLFQH